MEGIVKKRYEGSGGFGKELEVGENGKVVRRR